MSSDVDFYLGPVYQECFLTRVKANPGLQTTEDPSLQAPEGMSLSEACPSHLKLDLGKNTNAFAGTAVKASGKYYAKDKMFMGCDVTDITFDKLQSCKKYEIQVSSFEPRLDGAGGGWIMAASPQVKGIHSSDHRWALGTLRLLRGGS